MDCFLLSLLSPERPPSLLPAQDWVPILDKVFGQRWCSRIQDLEGEGLGEAAQEQRQHQVEALLPAPSLSLEPLPSSPQQDPRWTPLEDMEVFSPDEEAVDSKRGGAGSQCTDQSEGSCGSVECVEF